MIALEQLLTSVRGVLSTNVSLVDYTAWRTGGQADYFYQAADLADLASMLKQCQSIDIPITWLGLGSNTLVRDKGVEGLVIVTQGILNQFEQVDTHCLKVGVGLSSAQLARRAARLGLSGLEFMAGIPGTVGGALAMNAGCYGGETWQFVEQVDMMDWKGRIHTYPRTAFTVSYRQVNRPILGWFANGYFRLKPSHPDIALARIRTLLQRRNETQPMGTVNCGSVFRNPPGYYAAALIEQCRLKGQQIGGAVVSHKHANFIVNAQQATATDIECLIKEVQQIVQKQTGVQLVPEVCIIGRQ